MVSILSPAVLTSGVESPEQVTPIEAARAAKVLKSPMGKNECMGRIADGVSRAQVGRARGVMPTMGEAFKVKITHFVSDRVRCVTPSGVVNPQATGLRAARLARPH